MEVHLVSVEVGVVRGRAGKVEAEGRPVEHLSPVAHNTHLVQTRLAVEDDDVVVPEVPLDDPAVLEDEIVPVLGIPEVDPSSVISNDELGAGVDRGPVCYELLHQLLVERRHLIGDGEVEGHRPRDADLVDAQVGVGRDDGTRGEVDALAHKVAPDPALLALEPAHEGLERPSGPGRDLNLAPELVVHEGGDVVLQGQDELLQVGVLAPLLGVVDGLVVLDDVA
mmetsp:Transcript_15419/g.31430  ORF Transcript_15419/g.31430 Transcript_15419/m.31430 type:complete len:224 (-) Transcript_15419:876-1547(-)